jgi:hypothetical protein
VSARYFLLGCCWAGVLLSVSVQRGTFPTLFSVPIVSSPPTLPYPPYAYPPTDHTPTHSSRLDTANGASTVNDSATLEYMKNTFTAHYNGNRQPIGLYTHPIHLSVSRREISFFFFFVSFRFRTPHLVLMLIRCCSKPTRASTHPIRRLT